MVEKQQRVPLWWRQHPNGSYALFVRSGLKPIEFEKGKAAIRFAIGNLGAHLVQEIRKLENILAGLARRVSLELDIEIEREN
jgi:hypothetical protein